MVKAIIITVVSALALFLAFAATRPDTFHVERSTAINAAPDKIYPLINDLHSFNTWNPYEKKDPAIKGSYAGAAAGKGAAYGWQSEKVGVGSMEIVDTAPSSSVTMKLDFVKPFEAHNIVRFTLQPRAEAGATQVTWAMRGPVPYLAKIMHLVFDMDTMVGKDFEQGLSSLKTIAESR